MPEAPLMKRSPTTRILWAILGFCLLLILFAPPLRLDRMQDFSLRAWSLFGAWIMLGLNALIHVAMKRPGTWKSRLCTAWIGGTFAYLIAAELYPAPGPIDWEVVLGPRTPTDNSFLMARSAAIGLWTTALALSVRAALVSDTGRRLEGALKRAPKHSQDRPTSGVNIIPGWHPGKLILLWGAAVFVLLAFLLAVPPRERSEVMFWWGLASVPLLWVSWVWLSGREDRQRPITSAHQPSEGNSRRDGAAGYEDKQ